MPVEDPPFVLQADAHPAVVFRHMLNGVYGSDLTSFSGGVSAQDPGHGVVHSGSLAVTQNGTPNMSVNVAAGLAMIKGTQSALQGLYSFINDGTVNLAIAAADGTNPRRDLVIAQVRDAAYSGAANDARLTVVTGTPAASPADPSLASFPNALVLARVQVNAGVTSITNANITDLRTRCRSSWNVPWGLAAAPAVKTNQQTGISTIVDISGLSVSFTAQAGRRYRLSMRGLVFSSVANDIASASITDNSNNAQVIQNVLCASTTFGFPIGLDVYVTPGAGAVPYKGRLSRASGSGTLTFDAGATYPAFLSVEDVGPSA